MTTVTASNKDLNFSVIQQNVNEETDQLEAAKKNFSTYIAPAIQSAAAAADTAIGFPIFSILSEFAISIAEFQFADLAVKNRCMILANFLKLYSDEIMEILKTVKDNKSYPNSRFKDLMQKYEFKCTELLLYLLQNVFSEVQLALVYKAITGIPEPERNQSNINIAKEISDLISQQKYTEASNINLTRKLPSVTDGISHLTKKDESSVITFTTINGEPTIKALSMDTKYSIVDKMAHIAIKKLQTLRNDTIRKNQVLEDLLNTIKLQLRQRNNLETRTFDDVTEKVFVQKSMTASITGAIMVFSALNTGESINITSDNLIEKGSRIVRSAAEEKQFQITNKETEIQTTVKKIADIDTASIMQTCKKTVSSILSCIIEYSTTDLDLILKTVERDYESINAYTHVISLSYTSFITKDFSEKVDTTTETMKTQSAEINEMKVLCTKLQTNSETILERMNEVSLNTDSLIERIGKNDKDVEKLNREIALVRKNVSAVDDRLTYFLQDIETLNIKTTGETCITIEQANDKTNKTALIYILQGITRSMQEDFKELLEKRCSDMEEQIEKLQNFTANSELHRTTMISQFNKTILDELIPISETKYNVNMSAIQTYLGNSGIPPIKPLTLSGVSGQLVNENIMEKYKGFANIVASVENNKLTLLALMHKYQKDYNKVRFSILYVLMMNLNYAIFQEKLREYVTYNKMFLMACFDFLTIADLTNKDDNDAWNKKIFSALEEIPGVEDTESGPSFIESYQGFITGTGNEEIKGPSNNENLKILIKTNMIALSLTTGDYIPPMVSPPLERQPAIRPDKPQKEKECGFFQRVVNRKACDEITERNKQITGGTRRRHLNTKKQLNYKIKTRLRKKGTRKR